MKCLMNSWLRPSNRSASVTRPVGLVKEYCFSTLTQGRARCCALSLSCSFMNSFSFFSRAMRSFVHSSCDTIRCWANWSSVTSLEDFFLRLSPDIELFLTFRCGQGDRRQNGGSNSHASVMPFFMPRSGQHLRIVGLESKKQGCIGQCQYESTPYDPMQARMSASLRTPRSTWCPWKARKVHWRGWHPWCECASGWLLSTAVRMIRPPGGVKLMAACSRRT